MADAVPRVSDDEPVQTHLHASRTRRASRGQPNPAWRERRYCIPRMHRAWHGIHTRTRRGASVDRRRLVGIEKCCSRTSTAKTSTRGQTARRRGGSSTSMTQLGAEAARVSASVRASAELVKPERQTKQPQGLAGPLVGGNMPRSGRLCGRRSRVLDEVLVIARVSKTVMPVRVPTGQVFSHKLGRLRYRLVRGPGRAVVDPAPDVGDQVRVDA